MEKKPQYKVIVSDRARQMLADHVRFLAHKRPAAALSHGVRGRWELLEAPDVARWAIYFNSYCYGV